MMSVAIHRVCVFAPPTPAGVNSDGLLQRANDEERKKVRGRRVSVRRDRKGEKR